MRDARPNRILVVEDDTDLLQLLKFHLHAEGYDVIAAENGKRGVEAARTQDPDLVLLDLMMPEMDGYEVLRQLRSSYRTRYLPVIVATARTQTADRIRGLETGANDYVSKPYLFTELVLRIKNLLNWTREHRDMNPLTGLPGNACIEREITRRLENGERFGFLYVDVNNFKAYNDYYGYYKGDQAIRQTADALGAVLQAMGRESHFLGHVGGDDFIILTDAEVVEPMGEAILEEFARRVPELYAPEDRARGYIEVPNRRGELEAFPFMTLTVAGIASDQFAVSHVAELADRAFELKSHGKTRRRNVVVTERRRQAEVEAEKKAG